MKFVNVVTYKPKKGEVQKDRTQITQLAEYKPFQHMLADLTISGLNTSAKQAMAFYDSNKGPDDVQIPLLPRHVSADITEVQRVAQYYAGQKQKIEDKVRELREKRIEELKEKARLAQQAAAEGLNAPRSPARDSLAAPTERNK